MKATKMSWGDRTSGRNIWSLDRKTSFCLSRNKCERNKGTRVEWPQCFQKANSKNRSTPLLEEHLVRWQTSVRTSICFALSDKSFQYVPVLWHTKKRKTCPDMTLSWRGMKRKLDFIYSLLNLLT